MHEFVPKVQRASVIGITVKDAFTLTFAEALMEMNFDVQLLTYDHALDYATSLKISGKVIPSSCSPLLGSGLSRGIRDFLSPIEYMRLRRKGLLINTVANEILIPSDVAYVHFLHFSVMMSNLWYLAKSWRVSPTTTNMIGAVARAKILKLVLMLSRIVLVNSSFTRRIVKEVLGIDSFVLYPPVIMEHTSCIPLSTRKNWVVTISRFARDKRLERVLAIAKKVKSTKFFLVGMLWSTNYFQRLVRMAKKLSLENVVFLPNLPRNELVNLLSRAKLYLHTMPYEHFGISVVEGMAYGLVPIVHRSGGPWEDILGGVQGLYGYAYEDEDEAVGYINDLLNDEQLRNQIAERAFKRAQMFSEEQFKQRFKKVIELILNTKAVMH
jgi:glycosyltransferase involved in cell wall biosynthesis